MFLNSSSGSTWSPSLRRNETAESSSRISVMRAADPLNFSKLSLINEQNLSDSAQKASMVEISERHVSSFDAAAKRFFKISTFARKRRLTCLSRPICRNNVLFLSTSELNRSHNASWAQRIPPNATSLILAGTSRDMDANPRASSHATPTSTAYVMNNNPSSSARSKG